MKDWKKEFERSEKFIQNLVMDYSFINWADEAMSISSVPKGWEKIIKNLFNAMNRYQKTEIGHFEKTIPYRIKMTHNKFVRWVFKFLYKIFNPYRPFGHMVCCISVERRQEIKNSFTYKVRQVLNKLLDAFQFSLLKYWKIKYPPEITIHQVKEKFGGLRIYLSGADDYIRGMIHMSECMAYKTCQDSGRDGSLCMRDGWYRTLSPAKAKEHGFVKVEK